MAKRKEHCYAYPRPALTVDVVLFAGEEREARGDRALAPHLRVLMIRRGKDPFAGRWAFPGGFVDADEDLADAAARELVEETGLRAQLGPQLGAYGTPGRDPRGHTVSIVYLAWLVGGPAEVQGLDDAVDARWHDARKPPALAFDHEVVLRDAVNALERRANGGPSLDEWLPLMPREFSVTDVATGVAAASGCARDASLSANVRRRLRRSAGVRELAAGAAGLRFRRR